MSLVLSTQLGCANNGISPELTAGRLDNPVAGIPVRVGEVRDVRQFQASPSRTFVPSLKGDLDDRALRAKAVGRTIKLSSLPAENIVLDPPTTVESLVTEAAVRALRGAGYRVLDPGAEGYEAATAIDFEIRRLWMIQNRPTLPAHVRVQIEIRIVGPLLGFERGLDVEAYRKLSSSGMSRSLFRQTLERGLDDWTEKAQDEFERTRRALDRDAA